MTEQNVEEIVEAKALETLGLSKRVYSRLIKAGMTDLKQLLETLKRGDEEMLALPGLGPKSLAEVKGKLQAVVAEEVELRSPGKPEAQVESLSVAPSDSESSESRKEPPMAKEEQEKKVEEAKPKEKAKGKKRAKGKPKAEKKEKPGKKGEAKKKGKKAKGKPKAEKKKKPAKKGKGKGQGKKKGRGKTKKKK